MTKQTYKNLNIPNPTIREQFIPSVSIIEGNQRITYRFNAPYFLDKRIEMKVTNGMGYTKPSEKYGKNISIKELRNYLGEMDKNIRLNKTEIRNYAFANMISLINNFTISKNEISEIERKVEGIGESIEDLIEERDMYKKFYETYLENNQKELEDLLNQNKNK